ncbi:hypothetical protein ACFE04_002808 [Oxalis oulophora]
MENIKMRFLSILFLTFFFLTILSTEIRAQISNGTTKLFVFGDSYVDAGNWDVPSLSWLPPYGMTFPGKPSGRFSDGKVLSDFIAEFLGIESPIAYRLRQSGNQQNGINFAYGGTGVFPTTVGKPTLAQQIGLLEQLIQQNVYTRDDLGSSVALISVAGNDYGIGVGGGGAGNPGLTVSLINQLGLDLKRLKDLGLRKVAVTAIEPVGCLPVSTAILGYARCNDASNLFAQNHNRMLSQTVQSLNSNGNGSFFIVDLYNAFLTALQKQSRPGALAPCCGALLGGACSAGSVCPMPGTSFFWDLVHPAQHGWQSVYEELFPTLGPLKQ